MNKIVLSLCFFVSIGFYACKHTPPEAALPGGGTGSGGGGGTTAICFETQILPLFQSNCAKSNCHDASTHLEGYVLNSYDNLFKKEGKTNSNNIRPGNAASSDLYEVLFESGSKKMPPPGNADLTLEQKNLIARWINEGAKNTTGCTTSCDSNVASVSFKTHVQPILQNYCTGCHSGSAPAGGVNLTAYAFIQPLAAGGTNSKLYGVIAHLPGFSPMPKGSVNTIPGCEIALIRKWGAAGALNN